MKKFLLTLGLAALLAIPTHKAQAYNSAEGVDPKNATNNLGQEIETKVTVKSATASASEALVPGLIVMYDQTANDGYTVTRAVSQNQRGLRTLACATLDTVASGDTQYHACITKGFAMVRYDGTQAGRPIEAGAPACVNASGVVTGCLLSNAVEATANSGIVPLKSATDSGKALPVILNLR